MRKMVLVSLALAVLLATSGYSTAATQPDLGGSLTVSFKVIYKEKVGSPEYGKFVTVAPTLQSPYLKLVFDSSTGVLSKILFRALVDGVETTIMGCTPGLITNSPPKGKALTFTVQGMAVCTFCPQSGVASKGVCNGSGETAAISYLSLSGKATINNSTDQIATKLVVKGTMGGGAFEYVTSDETSHDAILTGSFNGTLTQVTE